MNMNTQKFFFGAEALSLFQHELRIIAPKTVFLFRGNGSYENCGAKKVLEEIFSIEGIDVVEWSDFEKNPKIEDAIHGVKLLRESGATVIIACGGGSVIDMAKLVRFSYSYVGELIDNSFEKSSELLPLFALPTTSGTGCETTPFAVCYKDHNKYSVAHENMLPDYAVVYPPFTYNNSSYLTACTGFDAFAQAIEAYWNINASPESDEYAEMAIKIIWRSLERVVLSPTRQEREDMSKAAYFAGRAISMTKTTAPHAFSYAFTSYCGYPHGHAVALTFPFFFEINVCRYTGALRGGVDLQQYGFKMERLLQILSLEKESATENFNSFVSRIGLVKKGFCNYSLKDLLEKVNLQRLANNPVVINNTTIAELEEYLSNGRIGTIK